ncbi:MAG: hypothetical protein ACON49_00610 [Candidatus Puniceispirillaceae bacterium]
MSEKKAVTDAKQQKADRLSQALRDNLHKRKAQARKRAAQGDGEKTGLSGADDGGLQQPTGQKA